MLGHLYLGQTTVYTSAGSRGSRAGDEAVRPLLGMAPTPWWVILMSPFPIVLV